MNDEAIIANFLYQYSEYIDAGDFESGSKLFAHARFKVGENADGSPKTLGPSEILEMWNRFIIKYPDGTPKTKHIVNNPIIEVDQNSGTATVRSYYTVLQQTDDFPLQVIICGRYHDRFERVDGAWRWVFRDCTFTDLIGDLSRHVPTLGIGTPDHHFSKPAAETSATLPKVRRVIAGHDGSGRSVVVSDDVVPLQGPPGRNHGAAALWTTQDIPTNAESVDVQGPPIPGPGGTTFWFSQFAPESDLETMTAEQREMATASPAEHLPGLHKGDTGRHYAMHYTETVDYAVILSGEVTMLLDEGEVTLRAGDTVVLRGAAHAWSNRGTAPVVMVSVVVGAQPLVARRS